MKIFYLIAVLLMSAGAARADESVTLTRSELDRYVSAAVTQALATQAVQQASDRARDVIEKIKAAFPLPQPTSDTPSKSSAETPAGR